MLVRLFVKYNSLKYLFVFLLLAVVRVVAYKMQLPILEPEITWRLVGERMNEGYTLYKDIWTSLEPFSAICYYWIDLFFNSNSLALYIVSFLLVLIQSYIFTYGLNKNKIFKEATILPALFYVLFSSIYFDFYTLSPSLLGMTFLLFALNSIYSASKTIENEEHFFYLGLHIGIASLFYLPYIFILLLALLSLLLYSTVDIKKIMTMVVAFLFPYMMLFIYYFWIDNLVNYFQFSILTVFNKAPVFKTDIPALLKLIVLPIILLLISAFAIGNMGKYIHYQYKIIKLFGLWILVSVLSFSIVKSFSPFTLILFLPPLAFFASHLFLLLQRRFLITEFLFWSIFGGIFIISFYSLYKPEVYTLDNYIKGYPKDSTKSTITNKRIVVLGSEKGYYINNHPGGPYIDWHLSKNRISDMTNYQNISDFYEVVEKNKPDVIVDVENKMPDILNVIPNLSAIYKKTEGTIFYERVIK